jgi:siroheme synthase
MPNSFALPGKVYLMPAGTAKALSSSAAELLQQADLVVHDETVAPEILELVPARTAVHSAVVHAGRPCAPEEIYQEVIEAAQHGQTVIRLKNGSAQVSDSEREIAALREARVEFEIVPGVTAAARS